MARRRKGRAVHGILLLDKVRGLSSNQALQQIKRLYGAAKAGHTGSLDPLATGLLPICLGEATKLSAQLLDADKTYRVTLRLGEATDSGDADGQVTQSAPWQHIDAAALGQATANFVGEIEQVPPMVSALKHQGRRLYELAREGQEVERPSRRVTIYRLELLGLQDNEAELELDCSKGTYVRTLVEDLARSLDSVAHVTALRRLRVGPFDEPMMAFAELQALADEAGMAALDRCLLPPGAALAGWPSVTLDASSGFYFRRGQAVQVRGAPTAGRVAAYGADEQLLGLAEIDSDGRVAPRRLLELRTPDQ